MTWRPARMAFAVNAEKNDIEANSSLSTRLAVPQLIAPYALH